MDVKKFESVLPVVAASLVNTIMADTGLSENDAMEKMYASFLYAALEIEETKVWQYSVPMLYSLYKSEMATGVLVLPEY